jgi:hypothetical protein
MAQDRRPILRVGESFHFHSLDLIVNEVSDENGKIDHNILGGFPLAMLYATLSSLGKL